jgi:hypothetical protein
MNGDDNQGQPEVIGRDFAPPTTKTSKEEARAVTDYNSKLQNNQIMDVKVASPFTVYYDGQAFSISGVNATGPFDILPKHHNFISLLEPCTLIIRTTKGDEQRINIAGGLLHVKADKTIVFLDI